MIPEVPFTWKDAQAAGIKRHQLTAMVDERKVRRVLQGVYVRADLPDDQTLRARAAALVMRPFGVLCDRSAAWLHGVDTFEFRELEILPPLETVVLRDHARARRRGCVGGERDLYPRDVCVVHGVRLTTALRTSLDLACTLSRRGGLAALDGFMKSHGITHHQMEVELLRFAGRRGVVQARSLVPLSDPRSESPAEAWTRLEILDAGLPAPEPQYWICEYGRPVFRVDLAYPRSRVIVEYDGREFHEGKENEDHDERRRDWLRRRGWTVIVVTKDDFKGPALDAWIGEVREALAIAA